MKLIYTSLIVILFACNSAKKSAQAQSKDLESGIYEIVELKSDQYKANETYTINLNAEENRISGKFDCNNFSCDFTKEGNNIEFGYAMATKMYCEDQMYNEEAFFGKLRSLKTYQFDGETLSFSNEEGEMILKLKKTNNE